MKTLEERKAERDKMRAEAIAEATKDKKPVASKKTADDKK